MSQTDDMFILLERIDALERELAIKTRLLQKERGEPLLSLATTSERGDQKWTH